MGILGKKSKNKSVENELQVTNEVIPTGMTKEDVTLEYDKYSQRMDMINNVTGVVDRAIDVWNTSMQIEQNIALINAAKEVELQKMVVKFELCKEILTQTFGQRQQGLNAHYKMLDSALKSHDREMIIASLRGISSIVASNPLEDFSKFIEAWDDKSKPLEIDF